MEATTYTDEQYDALDALERSWKATLPEYRNIRELIDAFPIGKTAAVRATRAHIKECKESIASLVELREVWSAAINKMKPKEQPGFIDWLNGHIEQKRQEYDKELRRYQYELNFLLNIGNEKAGIEPKSGVTEMQIAAAKSVEIRNLIPVNRAKKALCIFHDEKNPSMHVYGTRVWCYACNRGGDAIDVYQKLNGCDFITAVKGLAT